MVFITPLISIKLSKIILKSFYNCSNFKQDNYYVNTNKYIISYVGNTYKMVGISNLHCRIYLFIRSLDLQILLIITLIYFINITILVKHQNINHIICRNSNLNSISTIMFKKKEKHII